MPSTLHLALCALEKTFQPSTLVSVDDPLLDSHGIQLWVKRDDLLHSIISGNKWRKLKYCLDHALSLKTQTLISMGGVYSNHLHALAYTGRALGLHTVGLIRGEPPKILTPTLHDLENWGMTLRFISRSDYRQLRQYKSWDELPNLQAQQYWLPEGGAQSLALRGVAELVEEIDMPYDTLCVPCGTGTTLAGLITAVPNHVSVLGFAAFKHADFLRADIAALLPKHYDNWQLNTSYHGGGFAKTTPQLMAFMKNFELSTAIPLEPVYTGKMLYAIYDLINQGYFQAGQRIIAIHTGGLQGRRGFNAFL